MLEKYQKEVFDVLEKSHMIDRNIDKIIENHYANSKSALLLTGARQVGETKYVLEVLLDVCGIGRMRQRR